LLLLLLGLCSWELGEDTGIFSCDENAKRCFAKSKGKRVKKAVGEKGKKFVMMK
jgi:hypothetical protein